jgi:hypothetical protein
MSKLCLIAALLCYLFHVMVCEVRFAFTFWRHGARAPDRGVVEKDGKNVDILGEEWDAPGELTPSGMRMHYLLGARNRKRWENFLSSSYDVKELYVKSTDYNRTIMSVMSHLQGLYPASTGPVLSEGQVRKALPPVDTTGLADEKTALGTNALLNGIQVIPVHLLNNDKDYFYFYNPTSCTPLISILGANSQSDINVNKLEEINTNWGAKLRKALNIDDETWLLKFSNMYLVADSFVAAYVDDRTLQSFLDAEIDLKTFVEVAHNFELHNIFYNYNGDADRMFSKIVMSPIFTDAIRWMDTRVQYDIEGKEYTGYAAPKLVIYSTHDVNLGAAQNILNHAFELDQDFIETPYASSFIWELIQNEDADADNLSENDYTVKITYNDEAYLEVSFTEFKEKVKPHILTHEDLDNFCGWNIPDVTPTEDPVPTSYIDATIVLSCLLFVAVIAIIILIILLLKKPSTHTVIATDKVMPTV